MKVLAILASPRLNGRLAAMLERTVRAAGEAGHTVERIMLYQRRVKPCAGCMKCRAGGVCVITDDDLADIRRSLLSCDVVLAAAPTYFANIPGPLKTLFDRLSGAVMEESAGGIPKGRLSKEQKYLLLTACTTPAPFDRLFGQSAGALRAMEEFFKTAGMSRMGSVVFAGSKRRREVPERTMKRLERFFL